MYSHKYVDQYCSAGNVLGGLTVASKPLLCDYRACDNKTTNRLSSRGGENHRSGGLRYNNIPEFQRDSWRRGGTG